MKWYIWKNRFAVAKSYKSFAFFYSIKSHIFPKSLHIANYCLKRIICFHSQLIFLVLETASNPFKQILKDNPGQNIWNKFCNIIESNVWMKSTHLTPSNNYKVPLHTLMILFKEVRGSAWHVSVYLFQYILARIVGAKFQLKLIILIFKIKFAQKMYFQSKMKKVNITIEFYILELV